MTLQPALSSPPSPYKRAGPGYVRAEAAITRQMRVGISQNQGRKAQTSRSSWLFDLVALQKCVYLCYDCDRKFEPGRHGYMKAAKPPFRNGVIAHCDWCRTQNAKCSMFVTEGIG